MPYVPIADAQIEIGQPTKKEIFQRIKDNQESFNNDIEALKQTATIDIFNIRYSGTLSDYSTTELNTGLPTYKAPVNAIITSFVITLLSPSSSGTLSIMIQKSVDNGINWTNLLTSAVSLTGITTGSLSGSVSWANVAAQSFNQNELLRLNITGVQTNQGNFHVSIYGEVG